MLEARGIEISYESPLETRAQSVMEMAHRPGYAVTAEDNLLARLMQSVEGVEKFLLGGLFAGDKLHVIYQQDVHGTVVRAEGIGGTLPDCLDNLVGKSLGRDISNHQSPLLGVVADRLK